MAKTKKNEFSYIKNTLKDIENKIVIVTGANSGVGFAICDVLLEKHASIVMACRNLDRANKAKEELLNKHPDGKIDVLLYDQSTIKGSRDFIKDVMDKYPSFHALVLNAGVMDKKNGSLYENDITSTIGVNYISVLTMLEELKPYLDESEVEHRIVLEGSLVARLAKYKKSQLFKTNYGKFRKYNISKCGVLSAFKKYACMNKNPNTFYLYAEPGIANTSIIRNFNKAFRKVGYAFMNIFMHSNTCACLSTCYLVTNYVANGDAYLPKGIGHIKGLPKKYNIFSKPFNNDIVTDGERYLEEKTNGVR